MQENPFNKSGSDLSKYIKDFYRYVFSVVLITVAACLPLITHNYFYILVSSGLLLFFDWIALQLFSERKTKKWEIIKKIQLILVVIDAIAIVLYLLLKNKMLEHFIVYLNIIFSCIHSGFCFFDYRKDEPVIRFRYLGAIIAVITVVVVIFMKKWLNLHNIFI